MKHKNKKGTWALSYTGKIIIALVFTALGLFFVKELGGAMHSGYDKQLCKQSVILNSRIKTPGIGTAHFDVNCPTRYVTIDTDEIITETTRSGERKENVYCRGKKKGVDVDSEESLECFNEFTNKVIANLLYDCWDQFGMGRLEVFSEKTQDRQCVICSRIEFSDNAKKALKGASSTLYLEELNDYLKNNKPLLHDISYHQFLMDGQDIVDPYYGYHTDQTQGIIYRIEYPSKIKEVVGKVRDIIIDDTSGDEQTAATINKMLPYEEIKDKCDILK